MSSLASLPALAVAEEHLRELPIPTWAFGVIALGVFAALLGVLWSFRNTAAKTGQHDRGAHH